MNRVLAYLLTWTTYGSWLPGDKRGWIQKPGEWRAPDAREESHNQMRMTEPELVLNLQERHVVENTITEHCRLRRWWLHAVSSRSQHVHVVVAPERAPEEVLNQLKAWCTRRLREHQFRKVERQQRRLKWWTRGGSKRPLYDDENLDAAIRYVLEDQ